MSRHHIRLSQCRRTIVVVAGYDRYTSCSSRRSATRRAGPRLDKCLNARNVVVWHHADQPPELPLTGRGLSPQSCSMAGRRANRPTPNRYSSAGDG